MRSGSKAFRRPVCSRRTVFRAFARAVGAALAAALAAGCAGELSALDPQGPVAGALAETWWVMLIGASAILALVTGIMLYAVLRAPGKRARIGDNLLIVAGGVALPVVALTALLIYAVQVSGRVQAAPEDALRLEVIGHQWWWEVRYPDYPGAVDANEIHIPAGRPVRVEVMSADVIHSFWVPRLAGKIDVLPAQRNRVWFQADAPGVYYGQCAEFCGAQHARMRLLVVARPAAEFERWVARMQRPAAEPASAAQARGRDEFLRRACVGCHAIRGTPARARAGPDLTHLASRRTLAAATLPNSRENLAAWIADSQALKPGNRMPAFRGLEPAVLEDIVAYLQSLE